MPKNSVPDQGIHAPHTIDKDATYRSSIYSELYVYYSRMKKNPQFLTNEEVVCSQRYRRFLWDNGVCKWCCLTVGSDVLRELYVFLKKLA